MKLWLALLALLLPGACAAGDAPDYQVRDLGVLPGHARSEARAINKSGVIAGYSMPLRTDGKGNRVYEKPHAVIWPAGGSITDLGTLGGDESWAFDINDLGQVAGSAREPDGPGHAVIWEADGTIRDLGIKPARATGINNKGQVVGVNNCSAFLWTAKDGAIDLPRPPGSTGCGALAINDAGQIVGWSQDESRELHAVLWTIPQPAKGEITVTEMGTLPDHNMSSAYGINEAGQVVGESHSESETERKSCLKTASTYAFLWSPGVQMLNLGKPQGPPPSTKTGTGSFTTTYFWPRLEAHGINLPGTVVGSIGGGAFVWTQADGMAYLPGLPGKQGGCAHAISDSGLIVGCANAADGSDHAVVWTPTK